MKVDNSLFRELIRAPQKRRIKPLADSQKGYERAVDPDSEPQQDTSKQKTPKERRDEGKDQEESGSTLDVIA